MNQSPASLTIDRAVSVLAKGARGRGDRIAEDHAAIASVDAVESRCARVPELGRRGRLARLEPPSPHVRVGATIASPKILALPLPIAAWSCAMANAAKQKGDRGEREAVAVLASLVPDLVVAKPQRKLGAGRREDTGDLVVFPDVTVQVKTYGKVETALREAATSAEAQRKRADTRFALGMAPVPRARRGSVRWLAATLTWPGGDPDEVDLVHCGIVSRATAHLRREDLGIRRDRRIVAVERTGSPRLYVSTIEAWITAWRVARTGWCQLSMLDLSQLADDDVALSASESCPVSTPSSIARLRPAS